MIGRSGERGSGISVLAARHDDDDDGLITIKGREYRFGEMSSNSRCFLFHSMNV